MDTCLPSEDNIHCDSAKRGKREAGHTAGLYLRWLRYAFCFLLLAAAQSADAADTAALIRNSYGEVGMLDMPSARMAPDAQLAFGIGNIEKTMRFSINFQALPWLETSFRYSHFAPGNQNYDRSFSLKMRLLNEQTSFADVSIGVRDLFGTGVYSSEYLVATRTVGPLDITFGMGWGRLSDRKAFSNPLGVLSSSIETRNNRSSTDVGGTLNFGQYFRGPNVGLFGGAVWHTPVEGLSVIGEYSSDRYIMESILSPKTFKVNSPFNLGLAYTPNDYLGLSAGWYYGSTYGLTLTFFGDVAHPNHEGRLGPTISSPVVRNENDQRHAILTLMKYKSWERARQPLSTAEQSSINIQQVLFSGGKGVRNAEVAGTTLMIDANVSADAQGQCMRYAQLASASGTSANTIAMSDFESGTGQVVFCKVASASMATTTPVSSRILERKLKAALKQQELTLLSASASGGELWLYYENGRYNQESEALGRILRILLRDAPPDAEIFHLYPMLQGHPVREISVSRSALERLIVTSGSASELGEAISVRSPPISNPVLERASDNIYPRVTWSFGPQLGEQLFDPNEPIQFMLFAEGASEVSFSPGFSVGIILTSTIWSNYTFSRAAASTLPHVRTDMLRYLDEGVHGISYLGARYFTPITSEVIAEVKAGYLEDMFAGFGGQVLWRPDGSRFAVGADLYQVWQRDFNRLFGVQPYNVLTGHVTVYYESPWYGLNFAVHGGRYLAGDYGATFEVTRRFATGVEIGAFATFTDVPFSQFGEGSFDKGILIRIPLEWGLPFFTTTSYNLNLRSLTRDGGQRLKNDDSLFWATRRSSYRDITEHQEELVNP